MDWTNYTDGLAALFEQGGLILWAILAASIYMWILLVERYWFHWVQMPGLRKELYEEWLAQPAGLANSLTFRRIEILVKDLRTRVAGVGLEATTKSTAQSDARRLSGERLAVARATFATS